MTLAHAEVVRSTRNAMENKDTYFVAVKGFQSRYVEFIRAHK